VTSKPGATFWVTFDQPAADFWATGVPTFSFWEMVVYATR
jgi:hypothetical protein